MKKLIAMSLLALALFPSFAQAGLFTLSIDLWDVRDGNNDPIVGTWLLVADKNNNLASGFGSYTDTSSAWQWDSGDLLLARGEVSDNVSAAGWVSASAAGIDNTQVTSSTHVYAMWFAKPYDSGATGPGSNVRYGYWDAGAFGAVDGFNYSTDSGALTLTSPYVTVGGVSAAVLPASFGVATTLQNSQTDGTLCGWGSSVSGRPAATATFLAGFKLTDVAMQWRAATATDLTPSGIGIVSDVVDVTGLALGDVYALQLAYDEANPEIAGNEAGLANVGRIYLAWNNGGVFVNAVEGNTHAGSLLNPLTMQNFQGSFDQFTATLPAGYSLDNYLGAWGVDTTGNNVWAILDHNSEFAVVPEPATLLLLSIGGGLGLCAKIVRRRRATA